MWPLKKKGDTGADEPTLKTNVTAFWEWFAGNAERFYETIENKKCSDLRDEMIEAKNRWLPGMAWVFGPGANRVGHSLTISGEGVQIAQIAAEFIISQAPVLKNWTFYASRQPSDKVEDFSLEIGGDTFKCSELWVATFLDEQEEKIDIQAWHPLFAKMEEQKRFMILFLLLDEVLGEFGTGNWIGEIKVGDARLKESIPIWELKEYAERVEKEKGWKKYSPTETYSGLSGEPRSGFPRADIFSATTRAFELFAEYARAKGPIDHPLKGLGVDLVFVGLDRSILPEGKEVDFRAAIEDEIASRLGGGLGETLGGAMGIDWAYIDLILYDGQRSVDAAVDALRKFKLPKDTHIRWFTSDKADKVVRI